MATIHSADPRREAAHILTLKRAASVALFSTKAKIFSCDSTSSYVRLNKEANELATFVLESDLSLWAQLDLMTEQEQKMTAFELFDRDCDGALNMKELDWGLKRLIHHDIFDNNTFNATLVMRKYSKKKAEHMSFGEFALFLEELLSKLQATFQQICALTICKICCRETGKEILNEALNNMLVMEISEMDPDAVFEAISEVRMMVLFGLFQPDQSGTIPFKDVVKHLLHHRSVMDNLQTEVLCMLNRDSERRMDYDHFAELLFNVSTAFPEINVTDLADSITLSVVRADHDMKGLFMNDGVFEEAKCIESDDMETDAVLQGRVDRLHELWDVSGDGFLDAEEFALGMRKFKESQHLDATVSESLDAVIAFDQDGDGQLDKKEFGDLLRRFAAVSGVGMHELLDFMLIQSAMIDTDNKEKAYIAAMMAKKKEVPKTDEPPQSSPMSAFYQQATMLFFMQPKPKE
jgi:Ca2+-binding EF-hand superfamily protein